MALLKQIMLDAIDNSAEQAKKLINGFDWEKTKDELVEKRDQFLKFGDTFIEDVKSSLGMVKAEMNSMPHFVKKDGKAIFKVPYSKEDGDKLKWKIEDGQILVISVERNTDGYENKSTYKQSIPMGYGHSPSKMGANRSTKEAIFTFDKEEDDGDEFDTLD